MGWVNPYLDPQSVEAQKRFIRSIVSRHKASSNVDWDLINEPSMFDPARIFSDGPSSCHDRFEQQAFIEWLRHRHGEIEVLQERWNMTPAQLPDFASAGLPEAKEMNFDVQDMHSAKRGTRWLDYCLFSMDMHNRWVRQLYDTIKEQCPDQMVTVGQDEGLGRSDLHRSSTRRRWITPLYIPGGLMIIWCGTASLPRHLISQT